MTKEEHAHENREIAGEQVRFWQGVARDGWKTPEGEPFFLAAFMYFLDPVAVEEIDHEAQETIEAAATLTTGDLGRAGSYLKQRGVGVRAVRDWRQAVNAERKRYMAAMQRARRKETGS